MINYFYAFITSLLSMAILDAGWLGLVAPKFYRKHIGFIMAKNPNWTAAVAFYLVFILGLTIFVVYPGWHQHHSALKVVLTGGLFGFVTYATYDLTNQATLKNWPAIVTAVDMLWGTVLVGAVSIVAVSLLKAVIK
jgi:uncharacterized membrane protein